MEWFKGLAGRVRREPGEDDEPPEAPAAEAGEPLLETAQERRERWRSVYVIYFTMFQMSLGFSIVLTGVWPYLDKLLCALSFLASGSYQRICGKNVNTYVSQPSVSRCVREVVDALNHPSVVRKYIRFPQNSVERLKLKERFFEKFKIPGVIGCVDGTYVTMVRPSENEERYYCRKGNHARNIQLLEPGAQKEVLGLAVGANPLGQLVFSPLLGLWANRAGNARAPLLATLALFVLASVLYAELHLTRPYAKYWMVFARFLVGVSSANIAVARSYLSAATLLSERTRAVAVVSLAQVLGFVVGPALQAAAAPLGAGAPYPPPGDFSAPLRLDMYTAAGWINAVLGLINFLLFLPWCFKERKIAAREAMIAQGTDNEKEALKALKPDLVSSWTLVAAFFVLVFNFVLLETLATLLTMDQFAWSKRQALEYMGALMSAGAVVACLTFACIGPLTKVFEERALLLWGGFLLTGMASLLCIPWGPGPPPLAPANATEAGGGCPQATQPWCAESRGLTVPQFLAGYACVSVGYSLGVTLIQTIFSKVLGPRPQGVWMGVLTGAGCLSRALGPVFVSAVYARRGPDATFGSTAALTLAALAALRLVYGRLRAPPLAPAAHAPQELRPLKADTHT